MPFLCYQHILLNSLSFSAYGKYRAVVLKLEGGFAPKGHLSMCIESFACENSEEWVSVLAAGCQTPHSAQDNFPQQRILPARKVIVPTLKNRGSERFAK